MAQSALNKNNISINTKSSIKVFWEMMVLIFKSFFRDKRGPLFMYIVPIFFLTIFFYIPISGESKNVSLLFPYMVLPCMTILTSLSPAIVSWKNSVFLRRIDGTGIKKVMFLIALWVSYLLISYSGVLTQFIASCIIGQKSFITSIKPWNFIYFFIGVNLISITCIAIATLIGGISKNEGSTQGIVMMIYFASIFLSGLMIPSYIVEGSKSMSIITYFVPIKYAIYVYLYTQNSSTSFKEIFLSNGWNNSLDFKNIWIPISVSILIICSLFTIIVFTFKWTVKS